MLCTFQLPFARPCRQQQWRHSENPNASEQILHRSFIMHKIRSGRVDASRTLRRSSSTIFFESTTLSSFFSFTGFSFRPPPPRPRSRSDLRQPLFLARPPSSLGTNIRVSSRPNVGDRPIYYVWDIIDTDRWMPCRTEGSILESGRRRENM